MKKLIALFLLASLLLSLFACGPIHDGEVSVLWSDAGDAFLTELADALDRAMYIKNIRHAHYDAEGDAARQLEQARAAVTAGAAALIVNACDAATAAATLAVAKEAGIPILFLCSDTLAVTDALLATYDKAAAIHVNATTLYTTLGEKIAEDLLEDYTGYDRNGDGVITYAAFGTGALAVPAVNAALTEAGKAELASNAFLAALPTVGITGTVDALFADYDGTGNEKNATPVELILCDDDAYVPELLGALRRYHLNHEKLVTHSLPLYTVGITAPAGILLDSEDEKEKAAYTVMSAIDNGYVTAAALENDDALALSAAGILANLFRGKPMMDDIAPETVKGKQVLVPYTIYE